MDRNNTAGRLNLLSGERPGWQRLLIWGGIAFAALNILPLFFLFFGNTPTSGVGTFILAAAAFVVISLPFGGLNLLRTWFNGARADFTRRDDPARGGYVYDVRPARASWLPLLALLPLDRIADLDVGNNGVKVSQDVLVAGRGGIPTAELVKRGLTSRQAARSYTLGLRGDGQSRAAIIAGGLTYDCAANLQRDIQNAVARLNAVN